MEVNRRKIMTRCELKQLVCNTLDVVSYRIGLQYAGKNSVSTQIEDILDCYNNDYILSERQVMVVNKWLSIYKEQMSNV